MSASSSRSSTDPRRPDPTDRVRIGRIGRPHGRDGSFRPSGFSGRIELLAVGSDLVLEGVGSVRVAERRGTDSAPIVRLEGIDPARHRGGALLVERERIILAEREWLVDDLIGCRVGGLGVVQDIWNGPSADALVVKPDAGGSDVLVPMVDDAIRSVDPEAGQIDVDLGFCGLDDQRG